MLPLHDSRLSRRLLTALIASMVSFTVVGQSAPSRPRLVVGIMIDGLRDDYLDLLRDYFGDGGFKRLMDEGVMFETVNYGTYLDPAAATAMVYTGTSPEVNGIPAGTIYDPELRRSYSVMHDREATGDFSDATFTPKAITASTLSDEVRVDGAGFGSVYSIAPVAEQAIIMAGHAGNSAYWINETAGKWGSSPYYRETPQPMQMRSLGKQLSSRLDTLTWRPVLAPDAYPDLPAYKKFYPFRYLFQRNDTERYRNYKTSAPVNTEVTDLALDYFRTLSLGNHDAIDMLSVGYTLAPFTGAKDADSRIEMMDSYLRLDRDIARLISTIEKSVGLSNAVIMVVGTPHAPGSKPDDIKWGLTNGEFMPRRAVSLLNMYLMAKYGQGDWVSGYFDGRIYLNDKLIREHDLNPAEVRSEVADFLVRMSGVSRAWTIDDIRAGRAGSNADAVKRNSSVDLQGDVLIEVTPGWEIVEVDPGTSKETRTTVRTGLMSAPAFLLAPRLAPGRITEEIDARSIAPTVARLLRIRSPNATDLPPLKLPRN